ncbi:MAG: ribonuclease HII [Gemmatimonadota bacterium]
MLIGVDEVGRGPLAGPVVAAAVVFPAGVRCVPGVRDSKELRAAQRAALIPELRTTLLHFALGAASSREIDRFNIRVATAIAMRRAICRLASLLSGVRRGRNNPVPPHCHILIDGLPLPEVGYAHEALVDGDALCYSIAAAGIIAKTVRDTLMQRLSLRYPGYGWESNVGYGTRVHHAGLSAQGPTPHHRQTFGPVGQLTLEM